MLDRRGEQTEDFDCVRGISWTSNEQSPFKVTYYAI